MNRENLIMAIPSKGRLYDESVELLNKAGVSFEFGKRELVTTATLPDNDRQFTVALIRPKDIEEMIVAKKVDMGIVGSDTLEEVAITTRTDLRFDPELRVQALLKLGIGKCRLVLAAPQSQDYFSEEELEAQRTQKAAWNEYPGDFQCLKQFNNKTLATSYPGIFKKFVRDQERLINRDTWNWVGVDIDVVGLNGSVEAAPSLGIADGIVDLVETGNSLKANNLKPLMGIQSFEAYLVAGKENQKGDSPTLDLVRDRIFQVLLERGNDDALTRRQKFEQLQRQVELFR